MTRKQILMLFVTAGLVFALAAGLYTYRSAKLPSPEEVHALLSQFTERVADEDCKGARELMTPDTAELLRDPGTDLGAAVYRSLTLKSVENIVYGDTKTLSADVIFTTLDSVKLSAKAGLIFADQVTESGPVEDADAAIAAIYADLLTRDDLPVIDHFLIIRMTWADGTLRILGSQALQQALEGN